MNATFPRRLKALKSLSPYAVTTAKTVAEIIAAAGLTVSQVGFIQFQAVGGVLYRRIDSTAVSAASATDYGRSWNPGYGEDMYAVNWADVSFFGTNIAVDFYEAIPSPG